MSIFQNIFGAAPKAQPVQAAATPGNLSPGAPETDPVQTAGTAPNGTVPNNNATDDKSKSGLDQWADLWNTDPNAGTQGQPLFNVDQTKLLEAARKQNFAAGADPELLTKIAAGGPDAVQAMVTLMNDIGQRVYAQSAFAGTRLIEGALEKSNFARSTDIDNRFKSLSVSTNLQADNPIFNNPAAAPMLDMVKNQMLLKHPNASSAEITQMAKQYLSTFAEAFQAPSQQQQQQQSSRAAEPDWSTFLSG